MAANTAMHYASKSQAAREAYEVAEDGPSANFIRSTRDPNFAEALWQRPLIPESYNPIKCSSSPEATTPAQFGRQPGPGQGQQQAPHTSTRIRK